jgi:hypothetical protein
MAKYPKLLQTALGADAAYVNWYKDMLVRYPEGILQMESSDRATIASIEINNPLNLMGDQA